MCAQGMGAQAQYHPMVMPAMVSNAGLTAEQIQSLLAAQQEASGAATFDTQHGQYRGLP